MEPQNNIIEPNNKNHRILLIAIIILLTAAVIGGGTYYFLNQQIKKQNELITELEKNNKKIEDKKEATKTEEKKTETKVPTDFKMVKINDISYNYPAKWGTFIPEIRSESILSESLPVPTFKGEWAKIGDWEKLVEITDMESYEKSKEDYIKDNISLLKSIYDNKTLNPEDIYKNNGNYIPPVNAGTVPYNPGYVSGGNNKWRGFWYLARQGQALDAQIHFISILYNKEVNKVITIKNKIESKASNNLEEELLKNNDLNLIGSKIEDYMKSAYVDDAEVKSIVDNECLKVIKFLGL